MSTLENRPGTWPFQLPALQGRSPGESATSWRWPAFWVPKKSQTYCPPCSPATSWRCLASGEGTLCFAVLRMILSAQKLSRPARNSPYFPSTCIFELYIRFFKNYVHAGLVKKWLGKLNHYRVIKKLNFLYDPVDEVCEQSWLFAVGIFHCFLVESKHLL